MSVRARFERVTRALRVGAPDARELALAPLVGALVAAATNVVAVWVALRWPSSLPLRLRAQAFDAAECVTVAVGLGILPGLAALASTRLGLGNALRTRTRAFAYLAYAACASWGMFWVFGDHLERQADAVLEGRFASALFAGMVVGCGVGVLAAQWLGTAARAHSAGAGRFVALHGVAVLVANHVALRDDYANVHAAIAWIGASLVGAAYVSPMLAWLRTRPLVAWGTLAIACAGAVVTPSNDVRLELFRECGAVAPWVLARLVWRLPEVAPAPAPEPSPGGARASVDVPVPKPLVDAPVVVLVTVDALRADVVADPELERRLPMLAKLKKGGFYVPRAVAPGSQTSVSLSAMFSGHAFSAQRWGMFGDGSARFHYPASDGAPRFPEVLSKAGVSTFGFFALRFLSGDFGVTRGFRSEHMLTVGRKHAPAAVVVNPLLAALDKLGPTEPAFLYAHLTEPHEPYDRGSVTKGSNFERYLSEVEVVDGWLGRILQRLGQRAKGRGYLIVSADHGEAFGEHGTEFHTKTLYDELLRVPLLVFGPGIPARRCEGLMSLADVSPTVLGIFGLPPLESPIATSLLPVALGQRPCDADRPPVVAEGRLRRAYFTRFGFKAIEDRVHKTVEVFDLTRDPKELVNLFGREPRAEAAVAELRAFFAATDLPNYEPPYKP